MHALTSRKFAFENYIVDNQRVSKWLYICDILCHTFCVLKYRKHEDFKVSVKHKKC